jgi:hypothetical protein
LHRHGSSYAQGTRQDERRSRERAKVARCR